LNLMSRYVGPFSEELTSLTVSDQFFCVVDHGWPIETCPESFPDQRFGGSMIAAGSGMYVV